MDFGVNTSWTNQVHFYKIISELDTTYAGWRLPTETEVRNLWNHLFGNLSVKAEHSDHTVHSGEKYSLNDWNNDEIETFQEISRIFGYFETIISINRTGEPGMADEFLSKFSMSYFLTDAGLLSNIEMWTPVDGVHVSLTNLNLDLYPGEPINEWVFGALLVKKTKVPEPSSILILALGLLGISWRYRVKRG